VSRVTNNSNTRSNIGMDATDFPHDLVQLQHAWNTAYEALAAPRPRDTTALRRRLLLLSVHLWWHPYWKNVRPLGAGGACRVAAVARARGAARAA
jgi:hypothetical protein